MTTQDRAAVAIAAIETAARHLRWAAKDAERGFLPGAQYEAESAAVLAGYAAGLIKAIYADDHQIEGQLRFEEEILAELQRLRADLVDARTVSIEHVESPAL